MVDKVGDCPEEAPAGVVAQAPVSGVGAQDTEIPFGIVRLVPPISASDNVAEHSGGLDFRCTIRDIVGPRKPLVVFWTDDLRRLSLVDPLRGIEETFARVAVDVNVPE